MQPTKDEMREFLDVFDRLAVFEANVRSFRGYGAFSKEEEEAFPNASVVRVCEWLKKESEETTSSQT